MTDDVTPEPIEPAPVHHVSKGPRRAPLLAVLGLLVVGGLAAAVLVVRSTDERDADAALAAAQDAVADATSFRVKVRSTDVSVEGDTESGSETTTHSTTDGEWSDGVWHMRSSDQYSAAEWITEADGTVYSRYDEEGEGEIPADAQWEKLEGFGDLERSDAVGEMTEALGPDADQLVEDEFAGEMAVSYATMLYLNGEGLTAVSADPVGMGAGFGSGLGGEPTAFLDAIEQMGQPRLADSDTITATLQAGDDVTEELGQALPDGHIEVDLGTDDLPTALRLRVESRGNSAALDVTFSDWNTPIEIVVPGDDEVDATPWVEEEELEALPFAPVLPTAVPDGWPAMLVEVMPAQDYYDEGAPEDCQLFEIDYDEPVADDANDEAFEDAGYVWFYETTLDCAMAVDPTPFAPGGPAGLPSRTGSFGTLEVLVGETAIEVDSTLEGAELDAVVASLAPTDVDAVVAAAGAMAADWVG